MSLGMNHVCMYVCMCEYVIYTVVVVAMDTVSDIILIQLHHFPNNPHGRLHEGKESVLTYSSYTHRLYVHSMVEKGKNFVASDCTY